MSYCLKVLHTDAERATVRQFGHFRTCPMPKPEHSLILVIEDEDTGQIAGMWMAMNVVLLEGLYIAPEYRHKRGVAQRLFHGMISLLKGRGIRSAFTFTQEPSVAALAAKAGFTDVEGMIHVLTMKEES